MRDKDNTVMETLEFLAKILGTLMLFACSLVCLWMFFSQIAITISFGLGLWIYFLGYPWIGLVVAMVGSFGGLFLHLVMVSKHIEQPSPPDSTPPDSRDLPSIPL